MLSLTMSFNISQSIAIRITTTIIVTTITILAINTFTVINYKQLYILLYQDVDNKNIKSIKKHISFIPLSSNSYCTNSSTFLLLFFRIKHSHRPPLAVEQDIIREAKLGEEIHSAMVRMHHHCFIMPHHRRIQAFLSFKQRAVFITHQQHQMTTPKPPPHLKKMVSDYIQIFLATDSVLDKDRQER